MSSQDEIPVWPGSRFGRDNHETEGTVEESNLMSHARTELERAGLFDEDSDYGGMVGSAVMRMMEVFSAEGHSGYSAMLTLQVFSELAQYKPLSPITDDPEEWMHIEEAMAGDPITWQNRRKSSCFSKDGGKTYYDIDEPPSRLRRIAKRLRLVRGWGPMHRTEPA